LGDISWDSLDNDENSDEPAEEENVDDNPIDVFADDDENVDVDDQVEQMHLFVSDTKSPKTPMQAFARLTNEAAWMPFCPVNATTPKTWSDLEEEGAFDCLHKDHKQEAPPVLLDADTVILNWRGTSKSLKNTERKWMTRETTMTSF